MFLAIFTFLNCDLNTHKNKYTNTKGYNTSAIMTEKKFNNEILKLDLNRDEKQALNFFIISLKDQNILRKLKEASVKHLIDHMNYTYNATNVIELFNELGNKKTKVLLQMIYKKIKKIDDQSSDFFFVNTFTSWWQIWSVIPSTFDIQNNKTIS